MHYTSNLPKMPLLDPTSKQTGKCKGNASKTTKANNLNDKDLARPLSILPPHQDHGTINQFQWILIEPKHHKGIGEDEGEVHKEEM